MEGVTTKGVESEHALVNLSGAMSKETVKELLWGHVLHRSQCPPRWQQAPP